MVTADRAGRPAAPLIAVVIPTYNRAEVVENAIASVLDQSMADFELIIVDDGSTDDSLQRLRRIDDQRIRLLRQENQGVCAARNRGIQAAAASFVTWLDSDDLAEPGWLDFYASARAEGAMLASCGTRSISTTDGSSRILLPTRSGAAFGYLEARFLPGALAIDRELLLRIGAFRHGLRLSEHTDIALRLGGLALREPIPTVTTEKAFVRWHRRSDVIDPAVRYDSAVTLIEEDGEHLRRSRRLYATYLAIAGSSAYRLGRRSAALRYSFQAAQVQPWSARHWARLCRAALMPRRVSRPE